MCFDFIYHFDSLSSNYILKSGNILKHHLSLDTHASLHSSLLSDKLFGGFRTQKMVYLFSYAWRFLALLSFVVVVDMPNLFCIVFLDNKQATWLWKGKATAGCHCQGCFRLECAVDRSWSLEKCSSQQQLLKCCSCAQKNIRQRASHYSNTGPTGRCR